jgi:hypothetical protein
MANIFESNAAAPDIQLPTEMEFPNQQQINTET